MKQFQRSDKKEIQTNEEKRHDTKRNSIKRGEEEEQQQMHKAKYVRKQTTNMNQELKVEIYRRAWYAGRQEHTHFVYCISDALACAWSLKM